MAVFTTDLQGAASLLQKAIKKLDSVRRMDTVKVLSRGISTVVLSESSSQNVS